MELLWSDLERFKDSLLMIRDYLLSYKPQSEFRPMPLGKFFFLRHPGSGLILEIERGREKPGNAITTAYQLPVTRPREHQLWYFDAPTSTIRNQYNNYCIDLRGDTCVVNPFQRRNTQQRWVIRGMYIRSKDEQDVVLGLYEPNPTDGATVHAVDFDGGDLQQWEIIHAQAEYMYIKSQSNDMVLDVQGSSIAPGSKVIVYPNKEQLNDSQLWYEDMNGVIRSKLNDYGLTSYQAFLWQSPTAGLTSAQGGGVFSLTTSDDAMMLYPYDLGNEHQQWIVSGNTIQNRVDPEEVLEFRGGGWFTNPYLAKSEYQAKSNQLWTFEFIPHQVKSLSHPGIGKYVRIMSRLSNLYLTVKDGSIAAGNDVVLWDRKSELRDANDQLWYIDEKSGTIRSALHDYCLDLNDEHLVVQPFAAERRSQQWRVNGMKVYYACQPEMALQVEGETLGSKVNIAYFHSYGAQLWEVQNVPARCFYIKSFACDKVLAVKAGCRDSGAQVGIYTRIPEVDASQLWYEDEDGFIRNKLNGYMLDSSEDNFIKLRPYRVGNKNQHWIINEDTIQNQHETNMVLDIRRGFTFLDGVSVIAFQYHGKNHQNWFCEFL